MLFPLAEPPTPDFGAFAWLWLINHNFQSNLRELHTGPHTTQQHLPFASGAPLSRSTCPRLSSDNNQHN